jgi:hypothetical protein
MLAALKNSVVLQSSLQLVPPCLVVSGTNTTRLRAPTKILPQSLSGFPMQWVLISFLPCSALTRTLATHQLKVQKNRACKRCTNSRYDLATSIICGMSFCVLLNFLLIYFGPGRPQTSEYCSKSFHRGSNSRVY